MTFSVKQGKSVRTGRGMVPVYHVVDENGSTYCNVASEKEAQDFIPVLEAAAKRNKDAEDAKQQEQQQ
jgi:hypothetical protein